MYSKAYKMLVALPPLLWVGLFLLVPYALMLAHSFWAVHDGMLVRQPDLHNYVTLFSKPVYASVLVRTMRIAAAVTLCSLLLGYPLAYYLSFHAGAPKELLYQLVIVPLSIPGLLAGATFAFVLSLGDFLAPLLVGGASGTMIANVVQSLFGAAYDWPLGAAISVGLLIITVSLLFLSERLEKRWRY